MKLQMQALKKAILSAQCTGSLYPQIAKNSPDENNSDSSIQQRLQTIETNTENILSLLQQEKTIS